MNLAQDLRFAFRLIRKNLWFSAAIVVTLALGIGVNTTVFSLVNAALRKPLPFPGGERLVIVRATNASRGNDSLNLSYADFRDFRNAAGSFERLEAFSGLAVNISERANPPDRYRGGRVTSGMFEVLHTKPVIGRGILASDEKSGAASVLVIGYGVWADRYGKDPNILGRSVRANDKPATIVGVMPEGFKFPNDEDIWIAAVPDAELEKRNNRAFLMIGMLKQGASIAEAQADLSLVAKRLEEQFPDSHKNHGISVQTFHQAMNGGAIRLVFLLMLGAVGFVMLIACANVANMLLSKAVGRSREISIRAALGAGRWRLVRQLLVESVVLSVAGGVLGLILTQFGIRWFSLAVQDVGKPYWVDFSIDYVVLLYFAVVSVLAGVIFGIAPALRMSRVDLNDALKEGARSAGGRRGGYLSGALVVFQFALAVVLLSGAGLMIRSFLNAQDEFASVRAGQILHARVGLPDGRYATPESRYQFFEKLLPRLASLPGVETVALVSNPPGMGSWGQRMELRDHPIVEHEQRPAVSRVVAWPNYFRLLGLSLLQGREFEENDGLPGKESAIVTRQFAVRFFPKENPIGKQLRLFSSNNQPTAWMTIVGVLPDLRQDDPNRPTQDPVVFVPYRSDNSGNMAILMRTRGPVASLATVLRSEVHQADEELPLFEVQSLEARFQRNRWYLRVFGTLFSVFAVIALGMGAVGIYAVMAHSTGQRRQEIGVRMALGADFMGVLRLVLGRGVKQLMTGAIIGLAAAIAACRLMERILFKVAPNDVVTLALVTFALLVVGLTACWFPARRVAKLDPVKALRYE
jgi:putative ABC transport system permease protein